jgi:hypothetical protein
MPNSIGGCATRSNGNAHWWAGCGETSTGTGGQLTSEQSARAQSVLDKVRRLLDQRPKDKNKLYSLHAPEVECIGKGKTRQPCEFGVKVTVATTHREGLVVGMRAMPGNPYDGHTLYEGAGGDSHGSQAPGNLRGSRLP